MKSYQKLLDLTSELSLLEDAAAVLSWDQEVLLPKKGLAYRARQLAWISGEIHRRFTREETGEWIAECRDDHRDGGGHADGLDAAGAANLREWERDYRLATALPVELVEEFSETTSLAKAAWAEARERSDFTAFAPHLEKLVGLNRRRADCWGYEDCAYDALLDHYERGATVKELDRVLGGLGEKLAPLVEEAVARESFDQSRVLGACPVEAQEAFNREVAESLGFDFEAGRIDTAVHPFCSGMGAGDVRLTTRYDGNDFRSSLFGVLHEAGHGLYEQGLRPEWHGQPVGKAVSLGVHESQSRLWENHVGRSLPFWERWLPRAREFFPHLAGLTPEDMVRSVNQAERSHIRVEADEVTYDLHILLRYELEKGIFAGEIAVADLPGEWNRRYGQLFGLSVEDDREGCLQDIHWSMGAFGYFPTYSLGNLNASHLCAAALSEERVAGAFERSDFQPLLGWMREKIHRQGSLRLPAETIAQAAGSEVDATAHVEHLRRRYLG